MAPPGLQILVWWTKTHQSVGRVPVLPILEVLGHPTDPVMAYRLLLAASPTKSPDQSLLTYLHRGCHTTVMVPIPFQALATLLHDLSYDAGLFSLYSLSRGGGGGGSLPVGLGPDRHQTSGIVDQRCLLAVHHFILRCHLAACSRTSSRRPRHRLQHVHLCLHLLLATPRHTVIIRSPSASPPLLTTVIVIIISCMATLCWVALGHSHALSGYGS